MSDLKSQFEAAVENVNKLSKRPSNDDLLALYANFKQATEGDVTGKRPGLMNVKGAAKYDAWAKVKGTSSEAAMQNYLDIVERLQNSQ